MKKHGKVTRWWGFGQAWITFITKVSVEVWKDFITVLNGFTIDQNSRKSTAEWAKFIDKHTEARKVRTRLHQKLDIISVGVRTIRHGFFFPSWFWKALLVFWVAVAVSARNGTPGRWLYATRNALLSFFWDVPLQYKQYKTILCSANSCHWHGVQGKI